MRLGAAHVLLAVAAALASGGCSRPSTKDTRPAARALEVVEVTQGVEIRDPYRWMEQGGAELDAWVKAEDAQTRTLLGSMPARSALVDRVTQLMGDDLYLHPPMRGGGRTVIMSEGAGPLSVTIWEADGRSRVLADLARLHAADGRHVLVPKALVLSPDGKPHGGPRP